MSQDRFSKPIYKEFVNALGDASGTAHMSRWSSFSDYLECAFIAMSQPVRKLLTGEINAEREKRYHEVLERYQNPAKFAEAHALLVKGLEEDQHDFLGNVAGECGLLEGEWNGQFFTPKPVCDMVIRCTMGPDIAPDWNHRLKICEPAVGGGAMVLSLSSYLRERGFHPLNWWMDCTDKDRRMFQMAYIQLSLCGVPGVVRHGDSLSLEQWDCELTLTGAMFPLREREPGLVIENKVETMEPTGQTELKLAS